MTDSRTRIKTSIILAILGFFSCLITSLLVAFSILSRGFSFFYGILLIIGGIAYFVPSFIKHPNMKRKLVFVTNAILDIASGITLCLLKCEWHINSSYLNRLVVYLMFTAASLLSLSYLYTLITKYLLFDEFFGRFEPSAEGMLYFLLNIFIALVLALVIPAASDTTSKRMCQNGIVYSIGIWFFSGLMHAGLGLLILRDVHIDAMASNLDSHPTTEYDKV